MEQPEIADLLGLRGTAMTQTVEAVSSREVNVTFAILPWPHRYGSLLRHLVSHHPEQAMSRERSRVANPKALDGFHRDTHRTDDENWLMRGFAPAKPHRHLTRWGRIWEAIQWA